MYKDRLQWYQEIEKLRESKLLVYVTGDRPGREAKIHSEVLDLFLQHLDMMGSVPKISLYLYTRGGDTLTAWSIVQLVRQFADEFEVLVPSKAHSAGTLICLGAKTIVMTKQATLGPIDPSITTPLNPQIPGGDANARMPVSVEAINGFIELAKETGIETSEYLTAVLSILASHVHPLVLGQVFHTRSQIRLLGRRLLAPNMSEDHKIEKILAFLCSESGSHDYSIYRHEARDDLGLNIESPDEQNYEKIKSVYVDIFNELRLVAPYDPRVELGKENVLEYSHKQALIESLDGGSHAFVSDGRLTRQILEPPQVPVPQEVIQDIMDFRGWRYEPKNGSI